VLLWHQTRVKIHRHTRARRRTHRSGFYASVNRRVCKQYIKTAVEVSRFNLSLRSATPPKTELNFRWRPNFEQSCTEATKCLRRASHRGSTAATFIRNLSFFAANFHPLRLPPVCVVCTFCVLYNVYSCQYSRARCICVCGGAKASFILLLRRHI